MSLELAGGPDLFGADLNVGPLRLRTAVEAWPLKEPFHISGYAFHHANVFLVELESEGRVGQGEASGVYYKNDTPERSHQQIEALRPRIEAGLSRREAQDILPAGGARNALDCALWDLQAKLTGRPVWELAGLAPPRPIVTTMTCGAAEPEAMAQAARAYDGARSIKLKLTGDAVDAARVRAVRSARPDVWLGVDFNQGCTRAAFERVTQTLIDCDVRLVEQPFPLDSDELMDGLDCPIPAAADESVQTAADVPRLQGRFQVVNIKLDKCGGLTEALAMVQAARRSGLGLMVGNMIGTSLAMTPAHLVGQFCKVSDLDGAVFLKRDREPAVRYESGFIDTRHMRWGATA